MKQRGKGISLSEMTKNIEFVDHNELLLEM